MATVNLTQSITSTRRNEGVPADFRKTALEGLEHEISSRDAHKLLMDIRAQLTTADGKVKSGYLTLERSRENGEFMISNRSRFSSAGSKDEAAALIKKLVDIAYKEATGRSRDSIMFDMDTYFIRKAGNRVFGDTKMGTRSFVKLINQLELSTGGQAVAEKKANSGSLNLRHFEGLREAYLNHVATANPAARANPANPPSDLAQQAALMRPGDSIRLERNLTGGLNVGLGFKLPSVLEAGVERGVHGMGNSMHTLKRVDDGFVLEQIKFKGVRLSGGKHASAILELGASEQEGNLGHVKEQKFKFSTAEDAARFLSEGRSALVRANGAEPAAGEYAELGPAAKGFATRTESEVRGVILSRAQGITPVGGAILHQKVTAEGTMFKSHDGSRVAHRIYKNVHEKNNLGLTVMSKYLPGKAASIRVNSDIKLELRQTTAATGPGGTLASTFKPDLRVGIDAHIVAACKDDRAVTDLAEIEFNRTLTLMKAANDDAPPPGCFDLSDAGQTALRNTIVRSFAYIRDQATAPVDPAERARAGVQPTVIQGASVFNKSVGVKVLGIGASVGWTNGGMVTFRLPFQEAGAGALTRVSGQVEMGYTSRSANRFNVSVGINTEDLSLPFDVEAGVKVSGSSSVNAFTVTDRIEVPRDQGA